MTEEPYPDLITSIAICDIFSQGKNFDLVKTEIKLLKYLIAMNKITKDKLHNEKFFFSIDDLNKSLEYRKSIYPLAKDLVAMLEKQIETLPETIEKTNAEFIRKEQEDKQKASDRKARREAKKSEVKDHA